MPDRSPVNLIISLLALAGLCASVYLLYHHFSLRYDPDHKSFCNYSKQVNCDAVALHPTSEILKTPIASYGILYYLALLYLIYLKRQGEAGQDRVLGHLTLLTLLGAGISVYLFLVSWFIIESLCVVCASTYLINLLLVVTVGCAHSGFRHFMGSFGVFYRDLQVK